MIDEQLPEPEPKDIFEDFDPSLFTTPKVLPGSRALEETEPEPEEEQEHTALCPFYPKACYKAGTSQCEKTCGYNPASYIEDPHIREVFDKEPWSNWCFNCGEFIPSRNHEEALEPPEPAYSHVVATGYNEYRTKLSKWVMK